MYMQIALDSVSGQVPGVVACESLERCGRGPIAQSAIGTDAKMGFDYRAVTRDKCNVDGAAHANRMDVMAWDEEQGPVEFPPPQ